MSKKSDTEIAAILEIIGEFKGDSLRQAGKPPADLNFVKDLNLDSLELINLLFKIEEKYGIQISEAELKSNDLMVLGKMADFIAERRG